MRSRIVAPGALGVLAELGGVDVDARAAQQRADLAERARAGRCS